MPIGYHKSAAVREAAEKLYDELAAAGIEVLLDDRDERPGVMFADMELIGIPHRVVRRRARAQGRQRRVPGPRATTSRSDVPLADARAVPERQAVAA